MFARCTLLTRDGQALDRLAATARQLVTPGGRVDALLWHRPDWWILGDAWSALNGRLAALEEKLDALLATLRAEGFTAEGQVRVAEAPPTDEIAAEASLVLLPVLDDADALRAPTEALLDAGHVVGWVRAAPARITHVVVPYAYTARHALPAVAALRRGLGAEEDPTLTLLHVGLGQTPTASGDELRALVGWPGPVEQRAIDASITGLPAQLGEFMTSWSINLLTITVPAGPVMRGLILRLAARFEHPAPVLLVPDARHAADAPHLDGPDVLWTGPAALGYVEEVDGFGASAAAALERIALYAGGRCIAEVPVEGGRYAVPDAPPALLGLARAGDSLGDLLAAVRIVRPGGRVALLDAAGPTDAALFAGADPKRRFFAVRLDARRPCRALRARWRGTPVEALLDAGTVLRDGHPDDLPDRAAPIRLARVARHLRTAGVEVDLVLLDGPDHGYTAIAPEAWTALSAEARARRLAAARWPLPEDDNARLRTLTGAARTTATRLDLEFDNAVARERLLALIEGAEHRIALQTYIFEDDAIGRRVAAALIAAADRGVEVFVLVDSLYSLHGALGRQNPTLATLEAHRGVSLRAIRPFTLPDLGSLKQRDHRKLLIIDDRIGRITGRNLGAPYFTDFAEVPLTREHSYRDVPWLDIGAEVEGPIVHAMNLAFRESWLDAGGTRFRLPDPGPPGDLAVRLVLHESMRDAQTLDAYRALIEAATSHVIIVNTFPLQFELQSALIDALARGVTVRFLVGHVRPLFGEARQPFRGGALRALATEVIHGRLDALVAAGAEAWAYARRDLPGWAADLGTVLPHVHAKLMSVDGRRFTIGSANLDITAGYWESEALLLVEDEARTQALETTLGALFSEQAVRIDTDPRWRETSARRTFVSRNWPSVLG